MTKQTAETMERYEIRCPEGWEVVDNDACKTMEPDDQIWDFDEGCFHSFKYWIERGIGYGNEFKEGKVGPFMVIIREMPQVPKIFEPVKPEKLRVIRNIKRLIKK